MGCDYYLYKYLEIEHLTGTYYYLLKRERKYYLLGTSDNEYNKNYKKNIFEELYERYKLFTLKSNKTKTIYKNKKFMKKKYKNKYEKIILCILYNLKYEVEIADYNLLDQLKDIPFDFLNNINEKILFDDVINIKIKEKRYDSYLEEAIY